MRKIKEFFKSKSLRVSMMAFALVTAMAVPAFAAEGDSAMAEITTTLTTSFTQVAGDILKIIGVSVVAAMGVIGVKVAVKSGIGFFKSLSKGG